MKPAFFLACALALFSGCGKKTATAPASAAPAAATGKTADGDATSTPEADRAKMLARLTQTVRKFAAENQRVPKSLDELVAAGYLTEIPTPPGGKKFVIDQNLQVTLK